MTALFSRVHYTEMISKPFAYVFYTPMYNVCLFCCKSGSVLVQNAPGAYTSPSRARRASRSPRATVSMVFRRALVLSDVFLVADWTLLMSACATNSSTLAPPTISSSARTSSSAEDPLLNRCTQTATAVSTVRLQAHLSLGQVLHTKEWKLSLEFCVFPLTHLLSSWGSPRRLYTGVKVSMISEDRDLECGRGGSLLASALLKKHQDSFPGSWHQSCRMTWSHSSPPHRRCSAEPGDKLTPSCHLCFHTTGAEKKKTE